MGAGKAAVEAGAVTRGAVRSSALLNEAAFGWAWVEVARLWEKGRGEALASARHKLRGHLFSGGYKSIMVDDAEEGYLRRVCD